jgi:hypothetical protein
LAQKDHVKSLYKIYRCSTYHLVIHKREIFENKIEYIGTYQK